MFFNLFFQLRVNCIRNSEIGLCMCDVQVVLPPMEDIVDLEGDLHFPSTQVAAEVEGDLGCRFLDTDSPVATTAAAGRAHGRGRSSATRSMPGPSQTQSSLPQKVRGPNWTEQEMFVLIGQKRVEWDGRHNCSQPALAKYVYRTTAWKVVLAGCMSVVGFRVRDADQLTNKWDGLIKEYKKLKVYLEGTGSANWWGMSREEKRDLCKTRKLPMEFSESMYTEMESFVGKRHIFGRPADVVDSDRIGSPPAKHFGRTPPSPRPTIHVSAGSPATSSTTAPSPSPGSTPGDDIPGSTGRKRKSTGTDNLVDFVKDFNYEYLARVEAQERDRKSWRTEVMALDTAREARIAHKDCETSSMDNKLYELEVERTRNLSNMTNALLMFASSMDTLTRSYVQTLSTLALFFCSIMLFAGVLRCSRNFEHVQGSLEDPPLPFSLPVVPFPR